MAGGQMNTRIEEPLKRRGDEVLARFGYSPSQAVRALWRYVAENDQPPDFMLEAAESKREAEKQRKLEAARKGAGMALRMAVGKGLVSFGSESVCGRLDYEDLRDEMYAEKLSEYEAMQRG